MEEGSSGHGKVLILLHWQQVIFSFLPLVQIHLSLKVIVSAMGNCSNCSSFVQTRDWCLVKPKMCMTALPHGLYWENHSGNFFSGRNWVSLKHSDFVWKPKHQHFPISKAFIWTFFISAQEEYKIPDFKIHNVILPAIKPSLGQCGCTEAQSCPGWLFATASTSPWWRMWDRVIQNLPPFLCSNFSTELIVISYFVWERKPLSEILLAVGAHVTLSMHSSPLSYSTKRLANLFSCVRQMLWHLTDDFSTEMNFFACAVYFGTPLCSTRVDFLIVISQTSLEKWESSGKNYS